MNTRAHNRWAKESCKYNVPHLRLQMMAQLINSFKPHSYADIGCAKGLLGELTCGVPYIGIDFVRPDPLPDFEFHLCDLNSQQLPEVLADVDLVACSGILEYVDDLYGLLAKLNALTRPNAKILATYFNMNHISRIWRLLRGHTSDTHPDWRNFLSPRDMQALMLRAGFQVDRIIPVGLSVRGAPGVGATRSQKVSIPANFLGSYLLAHQFIFVLSK